MTTQEIIAKFPAEVALITLLERNGYMRLPNCDRRKEEHRNYKKGYEIRLIAQSKRDIVAIRRLLREVKIKYGRPFEKNKQWVQPLYGKENLEQFDAWLAKHGRPSLLEIRERRAEDLEARKEVKRKKKEAVEKGRKLRKANREKPLRKKTARKKATLKKSAPKKTTAKKAATKKVAAKKSARKKTARKKKPTQ